MVRNATGRTRTAAFDEARQERGDFYAQEDDDEDMTQEEKHLLKLKRRRERLALVLEEDDRLRRNKKKKKNMTRRKRRLGERLAHSKQLLSEIHLFVEEATERKNGCRNLFSVIRCS